MGTDAAKAVTPGAFNRKAGRREWGTLFGLLMPINLLLTLDRAALVLMGPTFMVEFGLTLVQTTLLTSAIIWTYSALQIPSGWLVSRFGVRWTMAAALVIWSSSMLLTPLAQGFTGLLALRILLGIGQAPDWSASMAAVKAMFDPTQRARANSILLSGMYLGTAIGGPATAFLVVIGHWHLPFVVFGGLGLTVAAVWVFVFMEPGTGAGRSAPRTAGPSLISSLKLLLSSRQIWSLGLTSMFLNGIGSLLFVLPLFLTHKTGMSLTEIAWLTSPPALTKYVAVLLAGVMADTILKRSGSVLLARIPMIAIGGLIGGFAAFASAFAPGATGTVMLLCLCYLGIGLAQVGVWCCVQDLTVNHTPVVTGCVNTCGNFGFATTPLLVALLVERFDWTAAFGLYGLIGIMACIAALFIRPDRPLESSPE